MRVPTHAFRVVGAAAALTLVLASCATVNKLGEYRTEGATLAANMRVPPEPTLDIHYSVTVDTRNPIGSALSVGTNLAKASQATKAEERMRQALASVDVPAIVLKESLAACAAALDARQVDSRQAAEFLLDLDIREYGLNAASAGSAVSFRMRLTARLLSNKDAEVIWLRNITVDDPASPAVFGVGRIVGNLVTTAVLAELSVEELSSGFEKLAVEAARSVARKLENDLYSARYGD